MTVSQEQRRAALQALQELYPKMVVLDGATTGVDAWRIRGVADGMTTASLPETIYEGGIQLNWALPTDGFSIVSDDSGDTMEVWLNYQTSDAQSIWDKVTLNGLTSVPSASEGARFLSANITYETPTPFENAGTITITHDDANDVVGVIRPGRGSTNNGFFSASSSRYILATHIHAAILEHGGGSQFRWQLRSRNPVFGNGNSPWVIEEEGSLMVDGTSTSHVELAQPRLFVPYSDIELRVISADSDTMVAMVELSGLSIDEDLIL